MKNITVSIDEETHRQARIRAAELDTSVSALVRGYLRELCAQPARPSEEQPSSPPAEVVRRHDHLDNLFAEFDAKGVGLDSKENLPREQLYDEVFRERDLLR